MVHRLLNTTSAERARDPPRDKQPDSIDSYRELMQFFQRGHCLLGDPVKAHTE